MTVPAGATHILNGSYYRKRREGGAEYWCEHGKRWVYMEDSNTRKVMRSAARVPNAK